MEIKVKVEDKKDKWTFYPEGDLDIYNSNKFKEIVLEKFEEENRDIEIDGTELTYIDSTGLGTLIYLLKELEEKNKKVKLININKNIEKLLKITELDTYFK